MTTERALLTTLADAAWPLLGSERVWLQEERASVVLVRVPAGVWSAFSDATAHATAWRVSAEGADVIYRPEGEDDAEPIDESDTPVPAGDAWDYPGGWTDRDAPEPEPADDGAILAYPLGWGTAKLSARAGHEAPAR